MNTTLKTLLEEKLGKGTVSKEALDFAVEQFMVNFELRGREVTEEETLDELATNVEFYNRREALIKSRDMRKKFVYRQAMLDSGNLEKAYQINKEAMSMLFGGEELRT